MLLELFRFMLRNRRFPDRKIFVRVDSRFREIVATSVKFDALLFYNIAQQKQTFSVARSGHARTIDAEEWVLKLVLPHALAEQPDIA